MTIRRDYTNGSSYICPAENEAIRNLDRPKGKPVTPRPYKNVLREQEAEALKKARALWNALAGIAAVMDYSITAIELKPKGGTNRYYKDATTKTLEKRC